MTTPTTPVLSVEAVSKSYRYRSRLRRARGGREGASEVQACRDVSLSLERGEIVALVGESGSGKSTLARMAAWLEQPDRGTIRVDGTDLRTYGRGDLRAARARFQMIPQDFRASLDPRWSARRILAQPLKIHGLGQWPDMRTAVRSLLEEVDLSASLANRRVAQLSGGQCQRLCIARAMALRPAVVVADEALSGLDVTTQVQVVKLIRQLRDQFGTAFLFVSHDLRTVRRLAHRVAVMYRGELVELAATEQVFAAPQHDYTRTLIESLLPQRFGEATDTTERGPVG